MQETDVSVQMYSFLEVKLRLSLKENRTKINPWYHDKKQRAELDSPSESTSRAAQ